MKEEKEDFSTWVIARTAAGAYIGKVIRGRNVATQDVQPSDAFRSSARTTFDEELTLEPAYEWGTRQVQGGIQHLMIPCEYFKTIKRVVVRPVVVIPLAAMMKEEQEQISKMIEGSEKQRDAIHAQQGPNRIVTPAGNTPQ